MAGHARGGDLRKLDMPAPAEDVVLYNPNMGREMLAHELGHGVSTRTKRGRAIRDMRANPI